MKLDDAVRLSIFTGACVSIITGGWLIGPPHGSIVGVAIWTLLVAAYAGWVDYRDGRRG